MIIPEIAFTLKDGRKAVLRSPRDEDIPGMLECLYVTAGETEFILCSSSFRQSLFGCLSECQFCSYGIYTAVERYCLCQSHNIFIKKRNPKFKRICHTCFVGFEKNISHKPHIYIKILHFGNIVFALNLFIEFTAKHLRGNSRFCGFAF